MSIIILFFEFIAWVMVIGLVLAIPGAIIRVIKG